MLKLIRLRPVHAVVALLAVLALFVTACSSSSTGSGSASKNAASGTSSSGASGSSSSTAAAPSTTAAPKPDPGKPVHMSLKFSDGSTFGVGIPVIATFKTKITSAVALQKATTVTVNGKPAKGAWYFEYSAKSNGYVMEGHYRLQDYWPAHSKIFVNIPAKGLSAGKGLYFDDSLTSTFYTGAAHILTVNDADHEMTFLSDGKNMGTFPVSLGAANTPTASGTKVIMEKGASICMRGPGYYECGVKYTQRLTYGGEYLHSAPWNISNIKNGVDSSNGCTNLLPADAQKLYSELRIGDVVTFPNANGPKMSLGAGYGDWNVNWGQWLTGGAIPTTA